MPIRSLTPSDLLRLRFIRDAQISPSGGSIAYVISYTNEAALTDVSEIWIHEFESGQSRRFSGGAGGSYPRWSRDGSRLAYVTTGASGGALAIARAADGVLIDVDISDFTVVGPPAWSPDNRFLAVILAEHIAVDRACRRVASRLFRADGIGFTEGFGQRLCLIDLQKGTVSTLLGRSAFYSQLEWDDSGEHILFLSTSSPIPGASYSPKLCSVRLSDATVCELLGDDWYIRSARWIPGGQSIAFVGAYRSRVSVPTTDLWVVSSQGTGVSCRSGEVKGRVGFRIHHDMPIWDAAWADGLVIRDKTSAGITVQCGGRAEIWSASLSGPERTERLLGGERACVMLDACADKGFFLFLATDLMNPPDLHVYDGHSERQITWLNRDVMMEWPKVRHRQLKFRSADGLELEGWFIAESSKAGPLPTVMFIHGGPFMAAGHAYRFDFHMLASHGFGVLIANFRGSFGYGEEFAIGIMGDWGARGFADHISAIEHAVNLGLADSARLGVWGASHGGFATCWIVGHSDRFRAAVAEAAVTNLETAYYLSDAPDFFVRDLGGKPREIPDTYRSRSPLNYAHRCRTPTLLIHGERDLRCPIAEAEQFHRALLDVGCISEIARLRDASHMGDSTGSPETRVGQNSALLDWFERFL